MRLFSARNTDNGIHIQNVVEDAPDFERIYTAQLDKRATITIRIKMFLSSIMKSGTLTQPNDRWVLFDPDAIADKILDPLLVPLIQQCVDEIYRLDREYRSTTTEYVDKRGHKWRRVSE